MRAVGRQLTRPPFRARRFDFVACRLEADEIFIADGGRAARGAEVILGDVQEAVRILRGVAAELGAAARGADVVYPSVGLDGVEGEFAPGGERERLSLRGRRASEFGVLHARGREAGESVGRDEEREKGKGEDREQARLLHGSTSVASSVGLRTVGDFPALVSPW